MNSETNILELPPPAEQSSIQDPASSVEPPPPADPSLQDSTTPASESPAHPAFGTGNRGRGYVARLPKAVRDQINNMIIDGVPYPEIIKRLGEPAKHLKPDHIHQWKKHGYQDWLLEREWLERLSSKAEFSTDILAAPHSSDLHEAGLRIAASQMFDQLMRFNAAAETGASDQPEKFARLVNALSRLTREALAFQKYRDALAKTIVELQKRDPDRDLVANELLMLVNKMDHTFKVARPELARLLAEAAGVPPPARNADGRDADGKPIFGPSVPNSDQPASGPSVPDSSLSAPGRGLGEVQFPSFSSSASASQGPG
jgi:hypothetical protein